MGPQYTTCVEPSQFKDLNKGYLALLVGVLAVGGLLAVFTGGLSLIASAAAFFEALRYVLDWLLNGKLVCLHRDGVKYGCECSNWGGTTVCAIGEVFDTEQVGEDKNEIEDLDDDYSINLALYPFDMKTFASAGFISSDEWVWEDDFVPYKQQVMALGTANPAQGDLLTRVPGMPKEKEVAKFGYLRTGVYFDTSEDYIPWTDVVGRDYGSIAGDAVDLTSEIPEVVEAAKWEIFKLLHADQKPRKFSVPVLHCEFEGSRTADVLDSIEGFPFGKKFCKKNWFTGLICKLVAALAAPFLLAKMVEAWTGNTEGSTGPALVGGGEISPKETVIVRGSWVFDAGHEGWNEVHAVRIVQKLPGVPSDPDGFKDYLARWCALLSEVPAGRDQPGVMMPPAPGPSTQVADAQERPENQWICHPAVDGCVSEPERKPEPDSPPTPPPIG